MLVSFMRLGVDPDFVISVNAPNEPQMGRIQAGLRGQGFTNENSDGTPVSEEDYAHTVGLPPSPFAGMTIVGRMGA